MEDRKEKEAENPKWKSLQEQIEVLTKIINARKNDRGKETARVKAGVQTKIEEGIKQGEGKLEDAVPLGKILWKQEKKCKESGEEAGKQRQTCGLMSQRKWNKAMRKAEEDRLRWYNYAIMWQGISHCLKESEEKKQKEDSLPKKTDPPPYDANVQPTAPQGPPRAGLYPVLNVTDGQFQIETAPTPSASDPRPDTGARAKTDKGSKKKSSSGTEDSEEAVPFRGRIAREGETSRRRKRQSVRTRPVRRTGTLSGLYQNDDESEVCCRLEAMSGDQGEWETSEKDTESDTDKEGTEAERLLTSPAKQMIQAEERLSRQRQTAEGTAPPALTRGEKARLQCPIIQTMGGARA